MLKEGTSWTVPLIIGIFIGRIFFPVKYEGENAEYWYNQYDYYAGAFEETLEDRNNKSACLDEIQDEASYFSFSDYEDLQDKLDNIESLVSDCY